METADFLMSKGIKALPYHAGLSSDERNKNQEAFNRDESPIIVATIAFSLGIDKSNVRFVIHADLPKISRAIIGNRTSRARRRTGPLPVFFSRGDIPKIRYFIDQLS